jgi:hypothetical protein
MSKKAWTTTTVKGKTTGETIAIQLVKYPNTTEVSARLSFDDYARAGWIILNDTKEALDSFFACIRKISGRHTPEEDRAVYELNFEWYDVAWELRNHHDDISAEEVIALYQKAFDEYDANIEIAV